MASRTINITVGSRRASGAYQVSASLVPDVAAGIAAAQTAAATAATDAAAAVAYATTLGLNGTTSVTLTMAQANSLDTAILLVQTDVAATTADIASALLSVPAGGVQVAYDTGSIVSWGQLRDGCLGAVRLAQGSGLKT